ncbi:MAG: PHB depolymerase family esterase, partial [bacterium]
MRTTATAVVTVALLAWAGSVQAQTIDAGRGALPVTVPAGYTGDVAAPLIVLLHTYSNTGAGQDQYMGLSGLSDTYGFIMVAPDGTPSAANGNPRFWNASSACCNWEGKDLDDVSYISGLIDAVKAKYRIDDKRVFILGHSNGAFMAHRLAYEKGHDIAAIVSLAGADEAGERPAPAHPIHVLQIHGTGDTAISYDGGEIQGSAYPSATQSVANWAQRNGCSDGGVDAGMLDLDRGLDGMESTITRHANGCKAGGSAELWTIADG